MGLMRLRRWPELERDEWRRPRREIYRPGVSDEEPKSGDRERNGKSEGDKDADPR